MGILDDAIREHLELKRQHGAEDEDLERLENEAFGPAARPGDPDFAAPSTETGEWSAADTGEGPAATEPGSDELVAEAAGPESEELATEPTSGGFGVFDAEAELGAGAEQATPAERARSEHAGLDDTADHPAPAQPGAEEEAEAGAEPQAEPEAGADRQAGEPEPTPQAEPEPAAAEAGSPEAPESDIFAGEDFGLGEIDVSIEDEPESAGQGGADDDEGEDDLLEETPDFLEETEGEDLWFEQGPPRDFDFDDD